MSKKQEQLSFTLIELLVIVAIVGILASVIVISVKNIRERAKFAKIFQFATNINHALGSDLIAEWKFDEGSGFIAKDSTGYYYDQWGDIYNNDLLWTQAISVSWITSPWQKTDDAIESNPACQGLNGNVPVVDVGPNSPLNLGGGDFTITGWIKMKGWGDQGEGSVIMAAFPLNSWYGFVKPGTTTGLGNRLRFYVGNQMVVTNSQLSDDNWYFVAGTYTNQNREYMIYINDKKDISGTWGSISWEKFSDDEIYYFVVGCLTGVDQVRIYNKSLTSAQIHQLYVQGAEKHDIVLNKYK